MSATGTATIDFGDRVAVGAAGVDPLWRSVVGLMTWEGATVTTQALSKGSGSWVTAGTLDNTQKKFGATSYLNTSGASFDWAPATAPLNYSADYTRETWVRLSAYPAVTAEIHRVESYGILRVSITTAGAVELNSGSPGATTVTVPNYVFPLSTWVHVCLMAKNSNLYLFLDGIPVATVAQSATIPGAADTITANGYGFTAATLNLDELRFSDVARYPVSGFTPKQCGLAPVVGAHKTSVAVPGQTGITGTSLCEAWLSAADSIDHSDYEHRFAPITLRCGAPTAGVGFTIYATSPVMLRGQWNVNWVWA